MAYSNISITIDQYCWSERSTLTLHVQQNVGRK